MNHQDDWQKISAIAIVHFFFSRGLKLFKELFVNASPALVGILVAFDDKVFWVTASIIAVTVLIIADVVILYLTYRYRVESEQIVIKHGLFTKEVLNLKYPRIQNINISVPWYFKPFKLVRSTLDSAGSTAKEAEIPGITASRADEISAVVNAYQKQHGIEVEEEADVENTTAEHRLLKLSNWEVTKFGFTNSMIFVFAGALFPVIEKLTETTGIDFTEELSNLASMLPFNDLAAKIILVLLSIVLFAFSLLCITALGAFFRFYNYELHDEGKKLKRIAGLLERQTISVNKSKVQGVSVKQNVFAKLLGRVTVYFQQVHVDAGGIAKKQSFLIPMLKPDQWQQQLRLIYPELSDVTLSFCGIHPQYLIKHIVYLSLLPVALFALPMAVLLDWKFIFLMSLSAPLILASYLRYKRYGYMVSDDYFLLREGLIGTNIHIIHRYKAQHLSETSSPAQRRAGLASMRIQMAYKVFNLPYVDRDVITGLINEGIYLTESTEKNWM